MSNLNVTNTFANGSTADADDVNQNFADVVDYINQEVIVRDGTVQMTGALPLLDAAPTSGNQAVRADDVYNVPAARVWRSSSQTIGNNAVQNIPFDTELLDTADMFDSGANTRLTIKRAGLYVVAGEIAWEANSTGGRAVAIRLNGSTIIADTTCGNAEAHVTAVSCATVRKFALNDYIELIGIQYSGTNLDSQTFSEQSPILSAVWVGSGE
jgi:hypothetical protein